MSYSRASSQHRASVRTRRHRTRRSATWVAIAAATISACTATTDAGATPTVTNPAASSGDTIPSSRPTEPTTTAAARPATTAAPPTTASPQPSTTTATTTTSTTTTTTTTTTTIPLPEPLDVFDPSCVVRTEDARSMERIASDLDVEVTALDLWAENGFVDALGPGALVDTCVANGINDIDGTPRPALDDATVARAITANVEQQQTKLNELFTGLGTGDLAVDGDSGPRTGQRLCAARLALGFPTTIADMAPGTDEQMALFSATALPTPASTATESERWVLIDRTCQIMYIGSGEATTFVFPTSTGSDGFETRDQERADAFRFNPALDNGGWHNSSEFPVGIDNPLNGNLYKPLYFDLGQAIHGANNVPPTPQSKGCARLRISDQETFIAWLGLDDVEAELWRKDEMNVTVSVQGDFVSR